MSLTDKIAEKLAGALGWLILKELRRVAVAIERGVDSHREIHGFRPIFQPDQLPKEILDRQIQDEQDEAAEAVEAGKEGTTGDDFMRQEILELLAQQNKVPYTLETDLVALGKQRGWLDEAGQILMLPEGYGE